MKCFIKVVLALIVLTGAEIAIASPIAAPVFQLVVGKTYVFDSTGYGNFLMNAENGEALEFSREINEACLWVVESGTHEGTISIKNVVTGRYLFAYDDFESDSVSPSYDPIDITIIQSIPNNAGSYLHMEPMGTISLCNENSHYLSVEHYGRWYAYEANLRQDLPYETAEVNFGNVRYEVFCPRYIQQAVAVGLNAEKSPVGGLVIHDMVSCDGVYYPVTSIRDCAFDNTGFDGKLSIGDFDGELYIGESVEYIGGLAFGKCRGFRGSLKLPNSVTVIGDFAFYFCDGFDGSLKLPDSLKIIGAGAFNSCSGFTGSLVLPNSLTFTGNYTFCFCHGFTGPLILPYSLTEIGTSAFWGCDGLSVGLEIPASVTHISSEAFRGVKFDKVVCRNVTPPDCSYDVFSSYEDKLLVPSDAISAYKMKSPWNKFKNI